MGSKSTVTSSQNALVPLVYPCQDRLSALLTPLTLMHLRDTCRLEYLDAPGDTNWGSEEHVGSYLAYSL